MSLIRPPVCSQITFTVQLASRARGGGVEVFLRGPLDPLVRMERYLHKWSRGGSVSDRAPDCVWSGTFASKPQLRQTLGSRACVYVCLLNEGWENTDSPGSAFTAGLSWQRGSRSSFLDAPLPSDSFRRREPLHLCETTAASCSARFSGKRKTDWSKY